MELHTDILELLIRNHFTIQETVESDILAISPDGVPTYIELGYSERIDDLRDRGQRTYIAESAEEIKLVLGLK